MPKWTSYFANKAEDNVTEYKLDEAKGEKVDSGSYAKNETKVKLYNKLTDRLNFWATAILFLAIATLIAVVFVALREL